MKQLTILDLKHNGEGVFFDNSREIIGIISKFKRNIIYIGKTKVELNNKIIYFKSFLKNVFKIKKKDQLLVISQKWTDLFVILFYKEVYYMWHNPKQHPKKMTIKRKMGGLLFFIYDFLIILKAKKVILASHNLEIPRFLKKFEKKFEYIPLPILNKTYPVYRSAPLEYDIIFFGTIVKYKGLDFFIDALKTYEKKLKILIIGKGQIELEFPGLSKKIKESFHRIEIKNSYISNNELAKYITKSKIAIFPYSFANGTQTVQLCYKYKTPVLASNKGAFKDYVKEGKTGYKFEFNKEDFQKKLTLILRENKKIRNQIETNSKMFKKENLIIKYKNILGE